MKRERFFIMCRELESNQMIYTEVEGKEVFRVNGFRFFLHEGDKISDVLSGCLITWWHFGFESYEKFIDRAKKKIENEFDLYISEVKKALRSRKRFKAIDRTGEEA